MGLILAILCEEIDLLNEVPKHQIKILTSLTIFNDLLVLVSIIICGTTVTTSSINLDSPT